MRRAKTSRTLGDTDTGIHPSRSPNPSSKGVTYKNYSEEKFRKGRDELEPFLAWDEEASKRFPDLQVCIGFVHDVRVERSNPKIEALRQSVTREVRSMFQLEVLKDHPTVRAYRDLFWSLGIDPTKTRPSGEALLRRVLHGDEIPRISTVVDAYNLASLKTMIPLSGFDLDQISPPFRIRFSETDDEFQGIGMNTPVRLNERMLVLADTRQIVCVYPYRDADTTKITAETKRVLVIGYGAPGISQRQLTEAVGTALNFIVQTSGGKVDTVSVFSSGKNQY